MFWIEENGLGWSTGVAHISSGEERTKKESVNIEMPEVGHQ